MKRQLSPATDESASNTGQRPHAAPPARKRSRRLAGLATEQALCSWCEAFSPSSPLVAVILTLPPCALRPSHSVRQLLLLSRLPELLEPLARQENLCTSLPRTLDHLASLELTHGPSPVHTTLPRLQVRAAEINSSLAAARLRHSSSRSSPTSPTESVPRGWGEHLQTWLQASTGYTASLEEHAEQFRQLSVELGRCTSAAVEWNERRVRWEGERDSVARALEQAEVERGKLQLSVECVVLDLVILWKEFQR